jgi:ABC-type phosphate transport system permease subunit
MGCREIFVYFIIVICTPTLVKMVLVGTNMVISDVWAIVIGIPLGILFGRYVNQYLDRRNTI